jgi:hypothetical protein
MLLVVGGLLSILLIGGALVIFFVLRTKKEEYLRTRDPLLVEIKRRLVQVVDPRLINQLQFRAGDKSYTINKREIFLCLRDPQNGQEYPLNMLMYVALHEVAHAMCDEIGHTDKFYRIFNTLLQSAEAKGVYDSTIPLMYNYCGYNENFCINC